jgi:hypothetical protein
VLPGSFPIACDTPSATEANWRQHAVRIIQGEAYEMGWASSYKIWYLEKLLESSSANAWTLQASNGSVSSLAVELPEDGLLVVHESDSLNFDHIIFRGLLTSVFYLLSSIFILQEPQN